MVKARIRGLCSMKKALQKVLSSGLVAFKEWKILRLLKGYMKGRI